MILWFFPEISDFYFPSSLTSPSKPLWSVMKTSFSWKQQQQFANHPINPDFSACCGVVNLLLMEKHDFSLPFRIPSFYEMKDDVAAFFTLFKHSCYQRGTRFWLCEFIFQNIYLGSSLYTLLYYFFTRDTIALGMFRQKNLTSLHNSASH